jgi:hypothetical protein
LVFFRPKKINGFTRKWNTILSSSLIYILFFYLYPKIFIYFFDNVSFSLWTCCWPYDNRRMSDGTSRKMCRTIFVCIFPMTTQFCITIRRIYIWMTGSLIYQKTFACHLFPSWNSNTYSENISLRVINIWQEICLMYNFRYVLHVNQTILFFVLFVDE